MIMNIKRFKQFDGVKTFDNFGKANESKIYGMDFTGASPEDIKRYTDMMDAIYNSGDMGGADDLLMDLEENYPELFDRYEDDVKDLVFGM